MRLLPRFEENLMSDLYPQSDEDEEMLVSIRAYFVSESLKLHKSGQFGAATWFREAVDTLSRVIGSRHE